MNFKVVEQTVMFSVNAMNYMRKTYPDGQTQFYSIIWNDGNMIQLLIANVSVPEIDLIFRDHYAIPPIIGNEKELNSIAKP